jgi:hypothetical protein
MEALILYDTVQEKNIGHTCIKYSRYITFQKTYLEPTEIHRPIKVS